MNTIEEPRQSRLCWFLTLNNKFDKICRQEGNVISVILVGCVVGLPGGAWCRPTGHLVSAAMYVCCMYVSEHTL